jgi:uncharacterized membrane protein
MIYGRNVRQLVVVWVFSFLFLVGVYLLERRVPALHEILLPFYWLAFGTAAFLTWRWLRFRSRGDRREGDRRHSARREDASVETDDSS